MYMRVGFLFENLKICTFEASEFSSGQNPHMSRVWGFLFETSKFVLLRLLNFPVVKILVCTRVRGFLFENLKICTFEAFEFSSNQNPRMYSRMGISF